MARFLRRSSVVSDPGTSTIAPMANPWNITSALPEYYTSESCYTRLPRDDRFIPIPLDFAIPGEAYHPVDPMHPPPIQFVRAPKQTPSLASHYFRPISIYALENDLCKGILPLYPVELEPHDIWQEDWARFMEDIVTAARFPLMSDLFKSDTVDTKLAKKTCSSYRRHCRHGERYPKAQILLELWNRQFFNLRGVHVQLKNTKYSPRLFIVSLNQVAHITSNSNTSNDYTESLAEQPEGYQQMLRISSNM